LENLKQHIAIAPPRFVYLSKGSAPFFIAALRLGAHEVFISSDAE